jgi:hypothetical protein
MRTPRINLSFRQYSDANLETKAGVITSNLDGNPNFPDLAPPIATVKTALDDYSAALLAAINGGSGNVAAKNAARAALQGMLRQLAMSVMSIANGDLPALTKSGFTLSKIPERSYIGNPGVVALANGVSSGQLISSVKKVKGAYGYLHQLAAEEPADATVWESNPSTRSKFVFEKLTPGKKYWVRVAATGGNGQIAYSPVASIFAQ